MKLEMIGGGGEFKVDFKRRSRKIKKTYRLCILYSHGILFLAACLSRQQRHETQQAITIMSMTETHPTMRRSWRLIWQFRPANQGWQSHLTLEGPFVLSPSRTHFPFLLQRSHSVVVAEKQIIRCRFAFLFFFLLCASFFSLLAGSTLNLYL